MTAPIALMVAAVNPVWWPVSVVTVIIRISAAWLVSRKVLKANLNFALLLIEDVAALCFWIAGFFGNTITWRGRRYRLARDGQFQLIETRGA